MACASSQSQRVVGATETGIRTIGNSIDTSANPILESPAPVTTSVYPDNTTTFLANFGNPYLPKAGTIEPDGSVLTSSGASVNVLFGVGPGVDYAAFEAQFLNPATAIPFALNLTWQALDPPAPASPRCNQNLAFLPATPI
jgi:hypothetical protein